MTDHKAELTVEQMIDNAHDNYMRGNIDATTRDYLIEKAKRTAAPAASEGADGALCPACKMPRRDAGLRPIEMCACATLTYTRPAAQVAATPKLDAMAAAYDGAREDLLDWKGRAQRAEARLRGLGWVGIDASEPPTPKHDEGRDLLPCPFCGGSNVDATGWAGENMAGESIAGPACDDCGASAGGISGNHAENVAAWNRRALATQPAARRVTDEDVQRACVAYYDGLPATGGWVAEPGAMRAALESFAQPAEGVSE